MSRFTPIYASLIITAILFSAACNKGSTNSKEQPMGGDEPIGGENGSSGGTGGDGSRGDIPVACANIDLDSLVGQTATCLTADTEASAHIYLKLRDVDGEMIPSKELRVRRQTELLELNEFQEIEIFSSLQRGNYYLQVHPTSETGTEQIAIEVPCDNGQSVTLNNTVTFEVAPPIAEEGSLVVGSCSLEQSPEKNIEVHVFDAISQAPIEGASVFLGIKQNPSIHPSIDTFLRRSNSSIPFEALQSTNENGEIFYQFLEHHFAETVSSDKLSIAAPGYENLSLVGISGSQIRVELKPLTFPEGNWGEIQLEEHRVRMQQYDASDEDPKIDFGAVLGASSIEGWSRFDRNTLLPGTHCWQPQPENNPNMRFMIPTNTFLPEQSLNGQRFVESALSSKITPMGDDDLTYFAMFGNIELAELLQPSNPGLLLSTAEIIHGRRFDLELPVQPGASTDLIINDPSTDNIFVCVNSNIPSGYLALCGSFFVPSTSENMNTFLPTAMTIVDAGEFAQDDDPIRITINPFSIRGANDLNENILMSSIIDARSAYPLSSNIITRFGPAVVARSFAKENFLPTKRFLYGSGRNHWLQWVNDPVPVGRPEVDYCKMTVHVELQKRSPSDCEIDGESLVEHQTIFTAPLHTFLIDGDVSSLDKIDFSEAWFGLDDSALSALALEKGIFNDELEDGFYHLSYFSDINCYGEVASDEQNEDFGLDQKQQEFTHFTSNKIPFPEAIFTSLPEQLDLPGALPGRGF